MKKAFTIEHDYLVPTVGIHAIKLDGAAPISKYQHIKLNGTVYPIILVHDNPSGIGLKDSPSLPESLEGERIEFVVG